MDVSRLMEDSSDSEYHVEAVANEYCEYFAEEVKTAV
jgi:hypothetical protein